MGGGEAGSVKESKDGELTTSHTFSVNATPFEPGSNASQYVSERWQDISSGASEHAYGMGFPPNWSFMPHYYDMVYAANLRAMTEMNPMFNNGTGRYSGAPIVRASSPNRKNNNATENAKKTDKDSLSIYAKPWSPTPESGLNQRESDIYTKLQKGWVNRSYRGAMVVAPIAFRETSNPFVHSFTIRPLEKPRIKLELFNYICMRCATRSFFGKVTSREADVKLKGVAGDIPPLRVGHLIEQVTGSVVSALFTEEDNCVYELWLEKPDTASHVANVLSGALWTCPMFHGFAVYAKTDEEKAFLHEYITSLESDFPEKSPYPMQCVEATASGVP